MRTSSAVVAFLLLTIPLAAQFPIGHATPVGGYTPSLAAESVWFGNTFFGFHISGGPPSAASFLAVSAQRQDQIISGLQIYVDVSSIFQSFSGPLDGTGSTTIPMPLFGFDDPALAGIQAYAQAAVLDPVSGLGTTAGLLLEVVLHPAFAFSSNEINLSLIDVVSPGATPIGLPPGTAIADVTFGHAGRDLFIAANNGLYRVDTFTFPLAAISLGFANGVNSLAWDRVHRRLYALSVNDGALHVIDGDRASPSFGAQITQSSIAANLFFVAISTDGGILAMVSTLGSLERRDGNPASIAYLQSIPTAPSPINFVNGLSVKRPHLTPDGRVVSIPVTNNFSNTSEMHRYDGFTDQWIDYAPGGFYQPLSSSNHASVPLNFTMLPSPEGTTMVLAGPSVARIALDLADPTNIVATTTPVAAVQFQRTYSGLSASGRFLVQREFNLFNLSMPHAISLVDVATGFVVPITTVPVTSVSQNTPTAWR